MGVSVKKNVIKKEVKNKITDELRKKFEKEKKKHRVKFIFELPQSMQSFFEKVQIIDVDIIKETYDVSYDTMLKEKLEFTHYEMVLRYENEDIIMRKIEFADVNYNEGVITDTIKTTWIVNGQMKSIAEPEGKTLDIYFNEPDELVRKKVHDYMEEFKLDEVFKEKE